MRYVIVLIPVVIGALLQATIGGWLGWILFIVVAAISITLIERWYQREDWEKNERRRRDLALTCDDCNTLAEPLADTGNRYRRDHQARQQQHCPLCRSKERRFSGGVASTNKFLRGRFLKHEHRRRVN